jgi:hypothetical protein
MLVSFLAYSSTMKRGAKNTGRLSMDYMALYSRRENSSFSMIMHQRLFEIQEWF